MLLHGDGIVYRREGKAAGGAAFTNADVKDLVTLLKAVRTTQMYNEFNEETGEDLVDSNVAKDSNVADWATTLLLCKLAFPETLQSTICMDSKTSQWNDHRSGQYWSISCTPALVELCLWN